MTAESEILDNVYVVRIMGKVSFNRIFTNFLKIMVYNLWTVHKDEMKYSESKGSLTV